MPLKTEIPAEPRPRPSNWKRSGGAQTPTHFNDTGDFSATERGQGAHGGDTFKEHVLNMWDWAQVHPFDALVRVGVILCFGAIAIALVLG